MVSSARVWTSVILAGKRSESVVVAGISYQMLEVQWIPGCLFFDNTRKTFKSNLVLVVVPDLESKSLYYQFIYIFYRKDTPIAHLPLTNSTHFTYLQKNTVFSSSAVTWQSF